MKISNHTTIAGEKVVKIVSAIGPIQETVKEGGVGSKFKTLSVLKSKEPVKNKDLGMSI